MIGKETSNIRTISLIEVLKILEEREKEGELEFEQHNTLEYAKKFVKLSKEKEEELAAQLAKLKKIPPETIVKLIDILPKTPSQVRLIFSKEKYTLTQEEINELLSIIKKYV